jgi:hypothetical protein
MAVPPGFFIVHCSFVIVHLSFAAGPDQTSRKWQMTNEQ